jgi:hypothetical protein
LHAGQRPRPRPDQRRQIPNSPVQVTGAGGMTIEDAKQAISTLSYPFEIATDNPTSPGDTMSRLSSVVNRLSLGARRQVQLLLVFLALRF